jgi:hypothetical protein
VHTSLDTQFRPNDRDSRISFLRTSVFEALALVQDGQRPCWGHMTPRQMVEHLIWSFEVSTGKTETECLVPEERRNEAKPFIFNDQRNPRNFQNPSLRLGLPPLRYPDLASAISSLRAEVDRFLDQLEANPSGLHTHPVFGPISSEDWSRLHYKHCFHHLAQFSLISDRPEAADDTARSGVVADPGCRSTDA